MDTKWKKQILHEENSERNQPSTKQSKRNLGSNVFHSVLRGHRKGYCREVVWGRKSLLTAFGAAQQMGD